MIKYTLTRKIINIEEFENVLFGQKSVEDGLNSAKTRADELIKLAK